jgi:hypothetical protein
MSEWTAPQTGRYHFATGQEPHLEDNCTDECRAVSPKFAAVTEDFAAKLDAASGPLKRMSAITAQIGLSTIPADAQCCCLCSIYEPHLCDGWRADDCVREVPGGTLFGKRLPPTEVPTCRSCFAAELRKA